MLRAELGGGVGESAKDNVGKGRSAGEDYGVADGVSGWK